MGKIYKNTTTIANNTNDCVQIPQASVVPLDQFEYYLELSEQHIKNHQLTEALQILVNLEITDFNNITVHEYLADIYLQMNQLTLAKEQCQICAQLMQQNIPNNVLGLKSFDQLISEIGDIDQLEQEFDKTQKEEISEENYHHQINIALKIATHYFSQQKYIEAENLLTTQRDKYMNYINTLD